MNKNLLLAAVFSVAIVAPGFAQQSTEFQSKSIDKIELKGERILTPNRFAAFDFDRASLEQKLAAVPVQRHGVIPAQGGAIVELPMPDGITTAFRVWEAPIMEQRLADKFPGIKTYKGIATDGSGAVVRFDLSHKGFRGQVLGAGNAIHIDPYSTGNMDVLMAYRKRDYARAVEPLFEELTDPESAGRVLVRTAAVAESGDELHTYRLAMACTGEYAQFHGGTTADALAAMVTTVNRINGIYERELSITLTLIGDNDQIIFLDGATDPYSGGSGQMLNQNQNEINGTIGNNNYDIGHVVGTGSGGIAALGSVCRSQQKARGVTGLSNPVGDFFDVDFVAHEMGHQFGGTHTFNSNTGSCSGNGTGSTAMEPGSGSTIMAYAGICGSHNLQAHSDDYFHTASYDQIRDFITFDDGADCPQITQTGNTAPSVVAGNTGHTLPMETPFDLIPESWEDADGDSITFCWESRDLGNFGHPDNPGANDPLFRSFAPTFAEKRQVPQNTALLSGQQVRGEVLPFSNRTLEWRCTVRDNQGGVGNDDTSIPVTTSAGPFEVTSHAGAALYTCGEPVTITWDVANTTSAPVNCQLVNIRFSADEGETWPFVAAYSLPNNGSATVLMPNVESSDVRFRVEAADNIFFNINGANLGLSRPSKDLGIPLLAAPSHWIDQSSNQVSVWLHNYGAADISNFTVSYTIDGGTAITENYPGTIGVGSSVLHTFATPFSVGSNGLVELCTTISGVSGDSEPANDSYCRTYQVALGTDFPITAGQLVSELYPNPATDRLQLRFGAEAGAVDVLLLDILGNVVSTTKLQSTNRAQTHSLDVSHLRQGTYVLMVSGGGTVDSRRVVIVD